MEAQELKLDSLWQNNKTGEIYQIVGFGKSANNATHGQREVYYKNLETQELYNRSVVEFLEKFESADMTTKVCRKCLSMQMAKFRDLNEKVCLCCGERVDWTLSTGQKKLL